MTQSSTGPQRRKGVARAHQLFRLWRNEPDDPVPFYDLMAREAIEDLEREVGFLAGQRIADLGCGPGFFTSSLRGAGAEVVPVDNSIDEASLQGDPPPGFVLADAGNLPFPTGDFDGVYCSNLLEHTPHAPKVLDEISRILKPGGWAYISWTNWYSPWGGHAISPWHYFGTRLGPALYERRHGGPPYKNAYGDGLWAVHIGSTLRQLRADSSLTVVRVEPRYWPRLRVIMRIAGVREVLAWNCVIWVRKR